MLEPIRERLGRFVVRFPLTKPLGCSHARVIATVSDTLLWRSAVGRYALPLVPGQSMVCVMSHENEGLP